jgi:hypothetical protein
MSGLQPSTAQPTSLTPQDNTAKINALIAYGFMDCWRLVERLVMNCMLCLRLFWPNL